MRISLIQTRSDGTKLENEEKVFRQLREAVAKHPDVICLSELFLSWGKDFLGGIVEQNEIKRYQDFASKNNVNIVLGSVALVSAVPNKTTNTCFIINRKGERVGRYDKVHMYRVNRPDLKFDEEDDTLPGKDLGIFEIDGVRIGVGICFDLRFPEYFRKLAKEGAQVVFLPSHFNKNTGGTAWNTLTRARAIENQVFFCAVNQAGEGLCGNTMAISYSGEILGRLGEGDEVLTVDLDLGAQSRYREENPFLDQVNLATSSL